jgi:glycerol-3-phosphate dehydrogenase (NAD(P)+)
VKINHSSIGVIGAGAWGTALSCLLLEKNRHVKLWAYEDQTAQNINQYRENKVFLPGVAIPEGIQAFSEINQVVADCETLVVASPVQKTRSLIREFNTVLTSNHQFVLAGKGIERESGRLLHEILRRNLELPGMFPYFPGQPLQWKLLRKNQQQQLLHQPILNWEVTFRI